MAAARRTRVIRSVLIGNGFFLIVVGVTVVSGWTAGSDLEIVANGMYLLLFGLLFEKTMPWWIYPRIARMLVRAVLAAGIASLVRLPHLPQGSWASTVIPGTLLLLGLAFLGQARWRSVGAPVSQPLLFQPAGG
jgi:hypothetical protein